MRRFFIFFHFFEFVMVIWILVKTNFDQHLNKFETWKWLASRRRAFFFLLFASRAPVWKNDGRLLSSNFFPAHNFEKVVIRNSVNIWTIRICKNNLDNITSIRTWLTTFLFIPRLNTYNMSACKKSWIFDMFYIFFKLIHLKKV